MRSHSLIIVVVALGIVTAALWWDAAIPGAPVSTARASRTFRWTDRVGPLQVSVDAQGPRSDGTTRVRVRTSRLPGWKPTDGFVLALDVSSSMLRGSLTDPQAAGRATGSRLQLDALAYGSGAGDDRTVIAFSDTPRRVAPGDAHGPDAPGLRTNLEAALRAAFDAAGNEHRGDVILVTDGLTNAGLTRIEDLAGIVAEAREKTGVATHVVALGVEAQTDLLQALATAGSGTYRFVRNVEELPAAIESAWAAAPGAGLAVVEDAALLIDGHQFPLGTLAADQDRQLDVRLALERAPEVGIDVAGSASTHRATEVSP